MKKINNTLAIAAFVAVSSFFAQKANAQSAVIPIISAPEFAELNIGDEFAELNIDDDFAELNIDDEETELSNGENTAVLHLMRRRSVDDYTQANQDKQDKVASQSLMDTNTGVKSFLYRLWR